MSAAVALAVSNYNLCPASPPGICYGYLVLVILKVSGFGADVHHDRAMPLIRHRDGARRNTRLARACHPFYVYFLVINTYRSSCCYSDPPTCHPFDSPAR